MVLSPCVLLTLMTASCCLTYHGNITMCVTHINDSVMLYHGYDIITICVTHINDSIMLYHGGTFGQVPHRFPSWVTDDSRCDRLLEVEWAPQGHHPLPRANLAAPPQG